MSFNLNVKNFGKLSDATINIGRFTVFAGPNNTGKSYISKLLYSLFDAMNTNHALMYFENLTRPLSRELHRLKWTRFEDFGTFSIKEIRKIEIIFKSIPNYDDLNRIEDALTQLSKLITEMKKLYPELDREFREWANSPQTFQPLQEEFGEEDLLPQSLSSNEIESHLHGIKTALYDLADEIKDQNAHSFIKQGIRQKIHQNLIHNFQVTDLSYLLKNREESSKISIDNFVNFSIQKDVRGFTISSSGLKQLQEYSRVIYLESPIYWKLKPALEDIKISLRHSHSSDREKLSQVPGYFYDLVSELKSEYTGKKRFQNIYEKLVLAIGGNITISETGKMEFQEGERNFSLHLAAVGVTNLGMLALLIEKKILDKGTFLFIDEPEAHLHPAWQVIMAETLFELAKAGVNVVIATHSADILKWLEVHVKNNPDDQDLIALNKFPPNGGQTDTQDFEDKVADIKQELTKPFADLYWRGL